MLWILPGCSTKKNGFTRRVYHNLTSHYNGYFNGKEALKDAQSDLAKNVLDNYLKILPVVNYGTKENVQMISPNLDRTIAKASMVIQRHSIYVRNVEHIRWIDDAYMLIGKADFYKQDYRTALSTFDFIQKRYKTSETRFDAQIWMAKCNTQLKEYNTAVTLLDDLQNKLDKKNLGGSLQRDLDLAYTEVYLNQENYGPAEEYLMKTLAFHHSKNQKARLYFILGQIQQMRGQLVSASGNYHKVIRSNPPYELAFNARINMAKCYDASKGNSKDIVKVLKKMLKDEKNKDYLDQVYYALAEIAAKDGDSSMVKEYLKGSVANSTRNKYQKGISSLKLANIYYREPVYPDAQAYYDTAVQSLPTEYPDLLNVKKRAEVLNDLVKYLNIVEREDSLQRLAKMPESERNKVIDGIIKKLGEEEAKKQREESERAQGMALMYRNRQGTAGGMNNQGGSGANWYFYNPGTLSFGFTEFEKKWGKRKLEDNWRLSDKQAVADFDQLGEAQVADSTEGDSLNKLSTDPKDKKTYEQNIPLTDQQMAKSVSKLKDALYNLGSIYYYGLSDFPPSVESYESLLKRYPDDTTYYLKSCYNLYEMCKAEGENAKAEHYKNLIITRFPESDFAKIIKDPQYKYELAARKNKAANLYKDTYLAYQNENYRQVLNYCKEARAQTNDKVLLSKFDYLQTIASGKIQGKDSLISGLSRFIRQYPNADLKPKAQDILDQLRGKDSLAVAPDTPGEKPKVTSKNFTVNPEAIHLYVIIADMKKINVNALKLRVSDHNLKYASLEKLTTSSLYLDDTHQIISVSSFTTQDKAMNYMIGVKADNYVFSGSKPGDYEAFVITVDNYSILYKNKDVEAYLNFYKDNYPQN